MQIQVLGPLRLVLPSAGVDVDVDLGPPKQRALLALMALRAGEWTSTDQLVDCLWGEVFAAAGESGLGVIEAAAAHSKATRHLWAIGVDSDQYETVQWLPGVVDPARWQAHILTSVTKSLHANIYDVVADHSQGRLQGGIREVGIASGAVDLSWSGGYLETHRATLEALRERIVNGELLVPDQP